MEKGGVFVVANIRGGGEFGPKWHQSALKANRPRAYEDFIAVAEDLIRRKVTSPQRLGIEGRSNGGLLMGNMLTMRPDLFGAIVYGSPLLDMRDITNYSRVRAGWVSTAIPIWPRNGASSRDSRPITSSRRGSSIRHPLYYLDSRRPRPSRTRPQDGGEDEGHGARPALL